MHLFFVASEAVPFVKTGGLADVVGALSKVLYQRGHDVRLVIPCYGALKDSDWRFLPMMPEMKVDYDNEIISGSVVRCSYPGTEMPVYLIEQPMLFDRKGIYGNDKNDYTDNDKRFSYFNIAALWLLKGLDWKPDIIHLHDWQTGLIPALLKNHPIIANDPFYQGIKTVFNIHNLAYQGNFDSHVIEATRLPWEVYTSDGMEFYNRASFLKAGLVYSDQLVAVSPSYAQEIQTEEQGSGMHGTLQEGADRLTGILNGIDTDIWNPSNGEHLKATFSAKDLSGKAKCKEELQDILNLPKDPKTPVVSIVSRMVEAKGFDLIAEAIDRLMGLGIQLVVLGTGDPRFEEALRAEAHLHPDTIAVKLEYNSALSHKIIAGSDVFLMPSKFEPCGLTQMYSMAYGTIPVAHKTGGLSDTIEDATPAKIEKGTATGFLFDEYTSDAMVECMKRALELYRKNEKSWKALQQNVMKQDHSWDKSAQRYEQVYEDLKAS